MLKEWIPCDWVRILWIIEKCFYILIQQVVHHFIVLGMCLVCQYQNRGEKINIYISHLDV
jgi:hypothetical protein